MVSERVPCALLFCSLLFSFPVFFSVAADWQIEAEVSPSPPSPAAHCDPLALSASLLIWQRYLGGLVSETLHNDSKVNSSCGSRVKGDSGRMLENFLSKLEAFTQGKLSGVCQHYAS